ncbi:ribosome silencing factor [Paramagnetospirillum magnetotacticum]|uniref:ribosome silencing factor n=1 Tax=Paramagnetospirillum magnetotacticum TaxID=188 RepID=UPI002AC354DD|nr:ribosome silencing factor [Paramagnetospirillum magnetotacticum]
MARTAARLGVSAHPASRRLVHRHPQQERTIARKPAAKAEPAPAPAPTLAELVAATLDDHKAEDVIVLDLKGRTSITDTMIIATGKSQRQVGAMADHVEKALKQAGQKVTIEGMPQCDWVLVDGGDIIVHLFRPEVRAFYNLEKMWGALEAKADAPTASAVRAKAIEQG